MGEFGATDTGCVMMEILMAGRWIPGKTSVVFCVSEFLFLVGPLTFGDTGSFMVCLWTRELAFTHFRLRCLRKQCNVFNVVENK